MQVFFDIAKKTTVNTNKIVTCIDSAIQKDYNKFINLFFKVEISNNISNDVYVLEKCLFVIRDLNKVIEELKLLGYNVSRIAQNNREDSSSAYPFLVSVDNEYRGFLSDFNTDMFRKGLIFREDLLPQSRFYYTHIHKNLSNKTTKKNNSY